MYLCADQNGDGDLKKNRQNSLRELDENVCNNPTKNRQNNPERKEKKDKDEDTVIVTGNAVVEQDKLIIEADKIEMIGSKNLLK